MDQAQGMVAVEPDAWPAIPQQARDDAHLLELWLHGRSPRTIRVYEADARAFLAGAGVGIRQITVGHLHAYQDGMPGNAATASVARRLSAVKSMLSYAHRLGYVRFNVGAAVKLPKIEETLVERIIDSRDDMSKLVTLEPVPRNKVLLRLLYAAGLRISEACGLQWRHLKARGAGKDASGQISVFGKGGKTRIVLLPAKVWRELQALRPVGEADAIGALPVFRSREGGALDPSSAHRVVKAACARAGLPAAVSAHWLRHAHASHALNGGAPIHLLQATLGHASVATTGRYLHASPEDSSALHLGL